MSTSRPASSGRGVAIQGMKLPFSVVSVSSFDEGHDGSELTPDRPQIKGWQSAKYCSYPQAIIIKFQQIFDIKKIQILSHQSKIANTVEIYSGISHSESASTSDLVFSRLGYLSLDSNERSQYKARELKSVYVNARGNYLKFTIKRCYENPFNPYNQVGIIAINVVGMKAPDNKQDAIMANISSKDGDEKTQLRLQELNDLKQSAISREDYDEAKRLKVLIDTLRESTTRLAQLEEQKRKAVENEDYDLAKQLKREIDYLRSGIKPGGAPHGHHRKHDDYDDAPIRVKEPVYSQQPPLQGPPSLNHQASHPHGHMPSELQHDDERIIHSKYNAQPYDMGGHVAPPHAHSHAHLQAPAQHREESIIDPEDRPIRPSKLGMQIDQEDSINPLSRNTSLSTSQPSYSHQPSLSLNSNDIYNDGDDDANRDPNAIPAPEPLTAANRKDAEPLIDVFGDHTVMCLYSKHWSLRQTALKDITQSILENQELDKKQLFSISIRVCKKGLSDKVQQIFNASCILLSTVLQNVAPSLKSDDVKQSLSSLIDAMSDKLSSSNIRERDGGIQILLFLALDPHVHGSLIPFHMMQPLKKKDKDSPLPLKARAKILLKSLLYYGVDDALNLSVASLMKFLLPHVLHRDAGVREAMFNLAAGLVSLVGTSKVTPFLKEMRTQTLEALQNKFDDVEQGRMVFVKPQQPNLTLPYVSEQDPTHSVAAAPNTSSPPPPPKQQQRQAAAKPQQAQHPPAHPPANQSSSTKKAAAGGGGAAGSSSKSSQQKQLHPSQHQIAQQQQQQQHNPPTPAIHYDQQIPLDEDSLDLQNRCQFCGLEDSTFTEEKLDLHYWSDCPMLISCKQCEQVIEIPTLNEHLLQECEIQGSFKQCHICEQPIMASVYAQHIEAKSCKPCGPGMNRCPLCGLDVPASEDGWKHHLLQVGCPKNTREVRR